MARDLNDVQEVIDHQMRKLEEAESGGQVNQLVHGLRIQLRKKAALGGHLTARERQILGHREEDAQESTALVVWLIRLIVLAVLVIIAVITWRVVQAVLAG